MNGQKRTEESAIKRHPKVPEFEGIRNVEEDQDAALVILMGAFGWKCTIH